LSGPKTADLAGNPKNLRGEENKIWSKEKQKIREEKIYGTKATRPAIAKRVKKINWGGLTFFQIEWGGYMKRGRLMQREKQTEIHQEEGCLKGLKENSSRGGKRYFKHYKKKRSREKRGLLWGRRGVYRK